MTIPPHAPAHTPEAAPDADIDAAARYEADFNRLDDSLRQAIADATVELGITEEDAIRYSVLLLSLVLSDRNGTPPAAVLVVEGNPRVVDSDSDAKIASDEVVLAVSRDLRVYDNTVEAFLFENLAGEDEDFDSLLRGLTAYRRAR